MFSNPYKNSSYFSGDHYNDDGDLNEFPSTEEEILEWQLDGFDGDGANA